MRGVRKEQVSVSVAVVFLAAFLWGGSCSEEKSTSSSKESGPVVIIGVDGMAWEVIRPLLVGKEYPLVKWDNALSLSDTQGWRYFGHGRELGKASFTEGVLRIDRAADARRWGVTLRVPHQELPGNRYRVTSQVKSLAEKGQVSIAVLYHYGQGRVPTMSGNNQAIWRTYQAGQEWSKISIEVQPPTTARSFSVFIFPYSVDWSNGFTSPSAPPKDQRILLRKVRLYPGELQGLDEKLDPTKLDPEKNLMPNLTALMKKGSYGYFQTLNPAVSPVVWTTIGTGQGPRKHGITTFIMPAPGGVKGQVLASSSLRKVPAIWNVVSDYGDKTVGTVSWWATWPAEKVDGFIVSDHANDAALQILKDKGYMPTDEKVEEAYKQYDTYPPELMKKISKYFADPDAMTRKELERFIPNVSDSVWKKFKSIERVNSQERLSLLKFFYAKDLGSFQCANALFAEKNPDLQMIYMNGVDALEHMVWHWEDHVLFPRADLSKKDVYGHILEGYYQFMDDVIGELVKTAGPDATVIVISDHGHYPVDFMRSRKTGPTGGHRWRCPGVFVAAGPALKENNYTKSARVFDITPTVLYLMDYPVAQNLEGRVLSDVIRPEYVESHPLKRVPRYEYKSSHDLPQAPMASRFDKEIKNRLRTLGYIE